MECTYSRYGGYRPGHDGDKAPAGDLEGDWATYARIAEHFVHKLRLQDREDFRHDLILELARVKAKYEVKGKLLTEAGMMRVCSYELKAYWDKQKLWARGMLVDCGTCSKERRRRCREEDLYSQCHKVKRFVSLNDVITDDGKELYEVLADCNDVDLDGCVDAKSILRTLPRRLILIAYKKVDGLPLQQRDSLYLSHWRQKILGAGGTNKRGLRKNPAWRDAEHRIMDIIRQSNGGISKSYLCSRLHIPSQELDCHLAPMVREGLVLEVKRETATGHPPTPILLAAGQELPKFRMVKTEQDERIRHAYFVEKKGIGQIARELHHSKTIVRRAIRSSE